MFDVNQGSDARTTHILSNCLDFHVKLIFYVDQGSDAPTYVLSNCLDFHVKHLDLIPAIHSKINAGLYIDLDNLVLHCFTQSA